jgi:hypothetical protein
MAVFRENLAKPFAIFKLLIYMTFVRWAKNARSVARPHGPGVW